MTKPNPFDTDDFADNGNRCVHCGQDPCRCSERRAHLISKPRRRSEKR